jgi:hypothetical protein
MSAGARSVSIRTLTQENRMTIPTLETLESRTLLSAGTLAAGMTSLFDTNGDGRNDAILVNTGASAVQYDYEGGTGLVSINVTANGGSFVTNMWVAQVGDNNPSLDFSLGSTQIGVNVTSGRTRYNAVAGDSSVVEGSLGRLEVGKGNLLSVTSTTGNIGQVILDQGNLTNILSAGAIDTISVEGDVLGAISAAGGINILSANRLMSTTSIYLGSGGIGQLAVDTINGGMILVDHLGSLAAGNITGDASITTGGDISQLQAGTISGANITTGGGIGKLVADTISGTASGTYIAVGTHVGTFQAQTVTGGANGFLSLTFGAGVDNFTAGTLDGGKATAGGFSGTFVNIDGDVQRLCVGSLSGGSADGAGSYAMMNLAVYSGFGADGSFQAGDVGYFSAATMTGGVSTNGGDVMLNLTIAHNLINAKIGQIIGSGRGVVTSGGNHGGSCGGGYNHGGYGGATGNYGGGCGDGGSQGGGGSSSQHGCSDPSIYLSVGNDIVKLVAGQISAGTAKDAGQYSSVNITAGRDIVNLTAGQIDAGTAQGDGSTTDVNIFAGRDIVAITAQTFSGGSATGSGASAGLLVSAGRDIRFIGSDLISGTQSRGSLCDPTVQFIAGGDIGLVMAGRITGGTVTSNGTSAGTSSVLLEADGTYVDDQGVQSQGNIEQIVTGTIDGGDATGAGALSHVAIRAAHDIGKLYADTISGGDASRGGFSYVSIQAGHDIVDLQADLITGADDTGRGCDPAVVIQACNDIKSLVAGQIIAGLNGNVTIEAGLDADGNVSGTLNADGTLAAGSIENLVVGLISGNGGIVNIAAGGDIQNLKVCKIIATSGDVDIVAGGDITASVGSIQTWSFKGSDGADFTAGGAVNDVRNSIKAQYTSEHVADVQFPEPPALPA